MSKEIEWRIAMTDKINNGGTLTKKQAIRYFSGEKASHLRRHIFNTMLCAPKCMSKATHKAVLNHLKLVEQQVNA